MHGPTGGYAATLSWLAGTMRGQDRQMRERLIAASGEFCAREGLASTTREAGTRIAGCIGGVLADCLARAVVVSLWDGSNGGQVR
ncbi:hypothetical protein OH799_01030 [Nocardia sp. NBC_00881]|uniref:hypothetical protein n=1 Tax=Nocardia sp. NBC_00881 TaxID=2975995 RepID=UPI0038672BBC|nr:hypothetical protein OH799_01030 [Nocardia sp. NBC_00881]